MGLIIDGLIKAWMKLSIGVKMAIEINGKKYKVIENLGFIHDRNEYAKVVMTEHGERVIVKAPYRGASWNFAKPIIIVGSGQSACGQAT